MIAPDGEYSDIMFYDPRTSFLGVRVITGPEGFRQVNEKNEGLDISYELYKKSFGIAEAKTMRNRLPFMFNADLLNGFSFNKGCYLGQELVSRSYFTGIVRRRIFPFFAVSPETTLKTD